MPDTGPAFFCKETGARIVAPGVCKAVDPENGQDLYDAGAEAPAAKQVPPPEAAAAPTPAESTPAEAPAAKLSKHHK